MMNWGVKFESFGHSRNIGKQKVNHGIRKQPLVDCCIIKCKLEFVRILFNTLITRMFVELITVIFV